MSTGLKREYLRNIRLHYHKSPKKQRSLILDEFCAVCTLTRKHAIRLLNEDMITVPKRTGPIRKYGAYVDRHLRHLWECMGRTCSKKMVAAMPFWLPIYHEADDSMKDLLMKISSATLDRHLESFRENARRGLSSTSPSLIKNKIPNELLDHQIKEPGFIEADTVITSYAHANCNLNLALASGTYLVELEKEKLREYQRGGACKVLDSEFKKCNEKQKSQLSKAFELREVLGNICMPHLPPPKPEQ